MPRTIGGRVKRHACASGLVGQPVLLGRPGLSASTRATAWTSFANALLSGSPNGYLLHSTTTEATSQCCEHACAKSAERAALHR